MMANDTPITEDKLATSLGTIAVQMYRMQAIHFANSNVGGSLVPATANQSQFLAFSFLPDCLLSHS
jgi:hypothetical protein